MAGAVMQRTRQKILDYLKQHNGATVEELSAVLDNLTAVTVRHHLDVLRSQGLVSPPEAVRRNSPGRPKYVYRLTEQAEKLFPKNLEALTEHVLAEMKSRLSPQQVNVIFEGVADRMAAQVPPPSDNEPIEARLDRAVEHLTAQGYEARWEPDTEGYVLYAGNCPYGGVPHEHNELCTLDMLFISKLLGTVPRRLAHRTAGDAVCSYLVLPPQKK